jgi:phosphatidylethanolamine/phosphatidyl-N-methylethanolamine N-methyltransferase
MRADAKLAEIDNKDVVRAYRRWAPIYDLTFGKLVEVGIKHATTSVNRYDGRVLEVGVGTGLSLPYYKASLKVTGIDLSAEMLAKARERVERSRLSNIEQLREMDATRLAFADQSFDVAAAMYVMTVVPDPAAVMHELARVTKIGGQVVIVNHFSVEGGLRGMIEKNLARFSDVLGWRPEFPIRALMVSDRLKLEELRPLRPMGLFTLLRLHRVF